MLDGLEITKSDRIKALQVIILIFCIQISVQLSKKYFQNFKNIYKNIIEKQTEYLNTRVIT